LNSRNNIGWTYLKQGKYQEAMSVFESVIYEDSTNSSQRKLKRRCYYGDAPTDASIASDFSIHLSEPTVECPLSITVALIGQAESYRYRTHLTSFKWLIESPANE
jgi:hypothetical protein